MTTPAAVFLFVLFTLPLITIALKCETSVTSLTISPSFAQKNPSGADGTEATCNDSFPAFCVSAYSMISKPNNYTVVIYSGCLSDVKPLVGQIFKDNTYTALFDLNCNQTLPAGKNTSSANFALAYDCCTSLSCPQPTFDTVKNWDGNSAGHLKVSLLWLAVLSGIVAHF